MSISLKRNKYLQIFRSLNHDQIKFQGPLILRMFGALNKMNLRSENRYILCNFLDQNSDLLGVQEDIYFTNNYKSLNSLFLLAYNKARESNLLNALYDEYLNSIYAISSKKEFQADVY